MRDLVSQQKLATYKKELLFQPSSLDIETKLREAIRQNCADIVHHKVDNEFSEFVEGHRSEDTNDTLHIEVYPKPGEKDMAFAVLTGCKWRDQVIQKFYKITL